MPPVRDPADAPRAPQVLRRRQDPRAVPRDRGARGGRVHRVPSRRAATAVARSGPCTASPPEGREELENWLADLLAGSGRRDPGLQRRGGPARVHHPGARRGGARNAGSSRLQATHRRARRHPASSRRTTSDCPASCSSSSNTPWRSRPPSSTGCADHRRHAVRRSASGTRSCIRAHFEAMHAADRGAPKHREHDAPGKLPRPADRRAAHISQSFGRRHDDRDTQSAKSVQVAQGRGGSGRRRRPRRQEGRDLRLPRTQRRRQDDDAADAVDAAAPSRAAKRRSPATTSLHNPAKVRYEIGYVSQEGSSAPEVPGRTELVMQGRLYGMTKPRAVAARRASSSRRSSSTDCADRATKTYSGGQKRRARHRHRAHAPARSCCSSTSRRPGLDPQSRARMWDEVRKLRDTRHDRVPDDALPRGGGRALRPHRDHRPRQDRRRSARRTSSSGRSRVTSSSSAPTARAIACSSCSRDRRTCARRRAPTASSVSTSTAARRPCRRSFACSTRAGIPLASLSLSRPSLDDVFLHQTGRSLRDAA